MNNTIPTYKNIYKSLKNINTADELRSFIVEHNKRLPRVGFGLNEEYGSDHYGYEIVVVSEDYNIIGFREINGCNNIHWAVISTDKRYKKNYGKYINAVPDENNVLHPINNTNHYWISEDLRPTEYDPSF